MDIRERSSQFSVYVLNRDLDLGAGIKVALSKVGYDAHFFHEDKAFLERVRERTPHVVIFSTADHAQDLNDFIEKVRSFGDEIRFVILGAPEQFEVLSEYQGFGVDEILSFPGNDLPARCVWATDRVCEKIYLTLQNEQLFEDLRKAKAAPPAPVLGPLIQDFSSAQSREELLQRLMKHLRTPTVFMKYTQAMGTFVATHAQSFEGNQLKGVGAQLGKEDPKILLAQLGEGKVPPALAQVLNRAFQFSNAKLFPLFFQHELEGVFAISAGTSQEMVSDLQEKLSLFSLVYAKFSLERKVEGLEVLDFVTDLYNKRHYSKVLRDEVERARRTRIPVSVIKISVDDFYEIEQSQGDAVRDHILKSIATIVTRTGRTNDTACRTQMNEIAIVLPHCSRKGGALRAERLRRIVESTPLMEGGKVSISLGISEFPTMCVDDETLDQTSTDALTHIASKGGNKICLYVAPQNHKPEFEVPAE